MSQFKRVGSVIEIKAEHIERYNELHANQWPKVSEALNHAHLHNYSIFIKQMPDKKHYLFSYFEYRGYNFDQDMQILAENPDIQRWWDLCKPMHTPFEDRLEHEWWSQMKEVFHQA